MMSDEDDTQAEIRRLRDKSRETTGPDADLVSGVDPLIENATAKHVAFVFWVLTAGCYGYGAAKWPAGNYPESSGIFLLLGLSIGVAMSATVVLLESKQDDD